MSKGRHGLALFSTTIVCFQKNLPTAITLLQCTISSKVTVLTKRIRQILYNLNKSLHITITSQLVVCSGIFLPVSKFRLVFPIKVHPTLIVENILQMSHKEVDYTIVLNKHNIPKNINCM